MSLLSLNLLIYAIGGTWRPIEWTSNCSKMLYNIYSSLVIYLMMFLTLAQVLDTLFIVNNMKDFASNMLFFSIISVVCKMYTSLMHREQIVDLIEMLQEEPCKPCDKEEIDIQAKFDYLIRLNSIRYMAVAFFSVTGGTVGAVLDILQGQLPFKMWVPYDISSPFLFWFTCVQVLLAVTFGAFINIGTETLILGFCLQTCAQLEILKYRLRKLATPDMKDRKSIAKSSPRKTNILSKHIDHHLCIIRYAKNINEVFSQVFFIQFFASILVLCLTVYYLSSHVTVEEFATLSGYAFCMFVQIFIYCWAGNEVMLKSTGVSEAVFEMDWILMTTSERKDILMIMKRSTKPIKLTSSFLVTLSLDSYGNILKASYSAYNVLNQ